MSDFLIHILIMGAGVWSIANLLVNEDGPLLFLEKLRDFVGVRYLSELEPGSMEYVLVVSGIIDRLRLEPLEPVADGDDASYALPKRYGTTEIAWALLCIRCTTMDVAIVVAALYGLLAIAGLQSLVVYAMLPFAIQSIALIANEHAT